MILRTVSLDLTELISQLRVFPIIHDTIEIETNSNSQIKAFYEDLRSRGRAVSIKTHCVKFDQLLPSCQLSQSAIYRRIRRFAAIFCNVWRWLKREGISSRWVTHVDQKPQLSEYEANRFLDSFRTKLQLKKNHKCLRKKDKMMTYSSLPPRTQPVLSLFQFNHQSSAND